MLLRKSAQRSDPLAITSVLAVPALLAQEPAPPPPAHSPIFSVTVVERTVKAINYQYPLRTDAHRFSWNGSHAESPRGSHSRIQAGTYARGRKARKRFYLLYVSVASTLLTFFGR